MPKRQTYTVCGGCAGWVFDWKLQRSGGWCNKCEAYISGWGGKSDPGGGGQRGVGKPPWAKQIVITSPGDEVQHIIDKFQLGKGAYATANVDIGPLQALQAQLTAKAPKPAEIPKAQALRQAINNMDQKKAALAKAASQLMEAQRWLGDAQEKHKKALEDAADAEEQHEATLRAHSSETIPSQDEDSAADWKAPEVDPELFANLDDYEAEDNKRKKQYTEFTEAKKQADAIHAPHKAKKRKANTGGEPLSEEEVQQRKDRLERLRNDAKVFFSNITQWGPKAHKFINEQGNDMDIIMMSETHMAKDKMKQVKVDVAKDGWKMAGTAAVPTQRSEEQVMVEEADKASKEKTFYITDETWEETLRSFGPADTHCSAPQPMGIGDQRVPTRSGLSWALSQEPQSWDGHLIIRDGRHRDAEGAATRMHGDWVTCLEEAAIATDGIGEEEAAHYRGRAPCFDVQWAKARSTPGRTHMKFGPAEQWGILNAILIRYQALRSNDTDGRQQAKCLAEARAQGKVLRGMDQRQVFGKKHGDTAQQRFYEMLGDLPELDEAQIGNLAMQAE
ncbi:unnamed protein product, partial [Prorocentrum cordatum]